MENSERRTVYAGGATEMIHPRSRPTPAQRRRLAKKGTGAARGRRRRYADQLTEARDRRRAAFNMAMLAAGLGQPIPAEWSKRVHMVAKRGE